MPQNKNKKNKKCITVGAVLLTKADVRTMAVVPEATVLRRMAPPLPVVAVLLRKVHAVISSCGPPT